jgi:hypothetical protein
VRQLGYLVLRKEKRGFLTHDPSSRSGLTTSHSCAVLSLECISCSTNCGCVKEASDIQPHEPNAETETFRYMRSSLKYWSCNSQKSLVLLWNLRQTRIFRDTFTEVLRLWWHLQHHPTDMSSKSLPINTTPPTSGPDAGDPSIRWTMSRRR